MSQEIVFQDIHLEVVDYLGKRWLRGPQLAAPLGLRDDRGIKDLYSRHSTEFTEAETAIVKLPTAGGPQDVRIFSPRGCWLLGMFARTERAAAFRRWVLDVLESNEPVYELIEDPSNPGFYIPKPGTPVPPRPPAISAESVIETTRLLRVLIEAGRVLGLPRGRILSGANQAAATSTGVDLVQLLNAGDVLDRQLALAAAYTGADLVDVLQRAPRAATHEDKQFWYLSSQAFVSLCTGHDHRSTAAMLRSNQVLVTERGRTTLKAPMRIGADRKRYYVIDKARAEQLIAASIVSSTTDGVRV